MQTMTIESLFDYLSINWNYDFHDTCYHHCMVFDLDFVDFSFAHTLQWNDLNYLLDLFHLYYCLVVVVVAAVAIVVYHLVRQVTVDDSYLHYELNASTTVNLFEYVPNDFHLVDLLVLYYQHQRLMYVPFFLL